MPLKLDQFEVVLSSLERKVCCLQKELLSCQEKYSELDAQFRAQSDVQKLKEIQHLKTLKFVKCLFAKVNEQNIRVDTLMKIMGHKFNDQQNETKLGSFKDTELNKDCHENRKEQPLQMKEKIYQDSATQTEKTKFTYTEEMSGIIGRPMPIYPKDGNLGCLHDDKRWTVSLRNESIQGSDPGQVWQQICDNAHNASVKSSRFLLPMELGGFVASILLKSYDKSNFEILFAPSHKIIPINTNLKFPLEIYFSVIVNYSDGSIHHSSKYHFHIENFRYFTPINKRCLIPVNKIHRNYFPIITLKFCKP